MEVNITGSHSGWDGKAASPIPQFKQGHLLNGFLVLLISPVKIAVAEHLEGVWAGASLSCFAEPCQVWLGCFCGGVPAQSSEQQILSGEGDFLLLLVYVKRLLGKALTCPVVFPWGNRTHIKCIFFSVPRIYNLESLLYMAFNLQRKIQSFLVFVIRKVVLWGVVTTFALEWTVAVGKQSRFVCMNSATAAIWMHWRRNCG